jgi:hypothetical protein
MSAGLTDKAELAAIDTLGPEHQIQRPLAATSTRHGLQGSRPKVGPRLAVLCRCSGATEGGLTLTTREAPVDWLPATAGNNDPGRATFTGRGS